MEAINRSANSITYDNERGNSAPGSAVGATLVVTKENLKILRSGCSPMAIKSSAQIKEVK